MFQAFEKSTQYFCRASIAVMKSGRLLETIHFDSLEAVGGGAGLFVAPNQEGKHFYIIHSAGGYDGRIVVIFRNGKVINAEGGPYFITRNGKYLFSEHASDIGGVTVINLRKKEVELVTTDVPLAIEWYRRGGEICFIMRDIDTKLGDESKYKERLYVYDTKKKEFVEENGYEMESMKKIEYISTFANQPYCSFKAKL